MIRATAGRTTCMPTAGNPDETVAWTRPQPNQRTGGTIAAGIVGKFEKAAATTAGTTVGTTVGTPVEKTIVTVVVGVEAAGAAAIGSLRTRSSMRHGTSGLPSRRRMPMRLKF
jgi:hypothetical protein